MIRVKEKKKKNHIHLIIHMQERVKKPKKLVIITDLSIRALDRDTINDRNKPPISRKRNTPHFTTPSYIYIHYKQRHIEISPLNLKDKKNKEKPSLSFVISPGA